MKLSDTIIVTWQHTGSLRMHSRAVCSRLNFERVGSLVGRLGTLVQREQEGHEGLHNESMSEKLYNACETSNLHRRFRSRTETFPITHTVGTLHHVSPPTHPWLRPGQGEEQSKSVYLDRIGTESAQRSAGLPLYKPRITTLSYAAGEPDSISVKHFRLYPSHTLTCRATTDRASLWTWASGVQCP